MNTTIWKFVLRPGESHNSPSVVKMPDGAKILSVQAQGSEVCMWAEVDPTHAETPYEFWIVGTGRELPAKRGTFLGTFQMDWMVFHVYRALEG